MCSIVLKPFRRKVNYSSPRSSRYGASECVPESVAIIKISSRHYIESNYRQDNSVASCGSSEIILQYTELAGVVAV